MSSDSAYRADQVGSLLRPAELLQARAAHREGRMDAEGLRAAEDTAILWALEQQRQIGLDVLTDGEYRRGAWMTDMAEAVEGFVRQSAIMPWKGPGGGNEASASNVVGEKLRLRRRLTGSQAQFLLAHAGGPFKMTIPSPSGFLMSSYKAEISGAAYPSGEALLADLSAIVRDEVAALASEGVPYIQLDTPQYSYYADEQWTASMRADGLDPAQALDLAIAADNACFEGIDLHGATTALHICRGNSKSRWVAEGGYEPIAEKLFGGLNVDRLLLEYDTARAGGFEPLRFVPSNKTVVLGLITTKSPALETRRELARRVDQAAAYVPLDRLALSPQCGFASVDSGNLLTLDDQRRKLELLVETVRGVWG